MITRTKNNYGRFICDAKDIAFSRLIYINESMDAGYRSAGLRDFFGCASPKAVKNNTVLLKVAQTIEKPNTIVAMSIYYVKSIKSM